MTFFFFRSYNPWRTEVMEIQSFLIWSILTLATLFDAREYKIPNQLIMLGYTVGLFLNIQCYHLVGIFLFIVKGAFPILTLYLLYHFKGLGAGDIKLFSVMSTLVGVKLTTDVMITSVMLAGVAVMFLLLYEGKLSLKRRLHYSFYMTAAYFILQFK